MSYPAPVIGLESMLPNDWYLKRLHHHRELTSRGSGGEAHARGAWGVSPQVFFLQRAEQTRGMRSE